MYFLIKLILHYFNYIDFIFTVVSKTIFISGFCAVVLLSGRPIERLASDWWTVFSHRFRFLS